MKKNAYALLGFIVWKSSRWSLRELLPSRRKLVISGLATSAALAAAAFAVARRDA